MIVSLFFAITKYFNIKTPCLLYKSIIYNMAAYSVDHQTHAAIIKIRLYWAA